LGHRMACSTINKIGIVLETPRGCSQDPCGPKRLQPEAIRLQNHGPGLEKTGEKANLGHRMACSTINKIGIVLETPRGCSQDPCGPKRFQPEAMGLQNHGPGLEKTGGKADLGHRMACSTINKIGIVLETPRGCSQDPCGPKRLQPEAMGLQNHGPGLEKTGGKANLGHRMACSTFNKMGIVLETLRGCSRDPFKPKRLQPEAIRLQNHGPGLEKTGAKADFDHRMACSTINKIGIVLETLRGCSRDPFKPKRLQPEAMGLQNHGPGLEKTGEKANLGPQNGLQPGIVLKTQGRFVWDFGTCYSHYITYFQ